MTNRSPKYDPDDPFHVHAFFMLAFICDRCGEELDVDSKAAVASDEWCAEAGDGARADGWRVPAASPEGALDVTSCLCPTCA